MADEKPLTVVSSEPLPTLSVVDEPAASPPTMLQQFWAKHPNLSQLAKGTLNTLPMAGAIAGGAAATPETFGAGTVGGAALGAGIGRGARDLLAEQLSLESPSSPLSKASRIALDTAITAATPSIAGAAKRILTDPKGTLADILELTVHPKDTADKIIEYLRTAPPVPPLREGFTLPQAQPIKLADGTWGLQSVNAGETIAPDTSVNVNSASGKTWITKMPTPFDPQADIRAAQMYVTSGLTPSQAALKAAGGNAARAGKILSYFMNSGGVK